MATHKKLIDKTIKASFSYHTFWSKYINTNQCIGILLSLLCHKISPSPEESPPLNICNPVCSALFLPSLLLPLGPGSPLSCLPVFLSHPGYSTQEAAKLQHALCVLEVCASHSDKTDFNTHGWKIAKLYAQKVQAQLDRGLVCWSDFAEIKANPHTSELIAAKQELEQELEQKKAKKAAAGDIISDCRRGNKLLCGTWNSSKVEGKCDWQVRNPDKGKCNRRHDYSYCIEKGHGTAHHQKCFCGKRIAAGDNWLLAPLNVSESLLVDFPGRPPDLISSNLSEPSRHLISSSTSTDIVPQTSVDQNSNWSFQYLPATQ